MDLSKYGPFADVVTVALALVAVFSTLLLKAVGSLKKWTWLAGNQPSLVVTVPARAVAVVTMGATYLAISHSNYWWFAGGAALCGVGTVWVGTAFDRSRRTHVVQVQRVAPDSKAMVDSKGRPVTDVLVIGTERDMFAPAKEALLAARTKEGLSLMDFMSGYGSPPNKPEKLWDTSVLVGVGSRLTLLLTGLVLLAIMTLFLIAFAIVAAGHTTS